MICKTSYRTGSNITVKTSWLGGKTENSVPVYSRDSLGFTVVL